MKGLVHSSICTKQERFWRHSILSRSLMAKVLSLTCTLWEDLHWNCLSHSWDNKYVWNANLINIFCVCTMETKKRSRATQINEVKYGFGFVIPCSFLFMLAFPWFILFLVTPHWLKSWQMWSSQCPITAILTRFQFVLDPKGTCVVPLPQTRSRVWIQSVL